jgi:hypothetical protein
MPKVSICAQKARLRDPAAQNPDQYVADLTYRELFELNRFSNHRLHSDALNKVMTCQVQPL